MRTSISQCVYVYLNTFEWQNCVMIVTVVNRGITLQLSDRQEVVEYLHLMGYGQAIPLPDGTYQVEKQGMDVPAVIRI